MDVHTSEEVYFSILVFFNLLGCSSDVVHDFYHVFMTDCLRSKMLVLSTTVQMSNVGYNFFYYSFITKDWQYIEIRHNITQFCPIKATLHFAKPTPIWST